MGKKELNIIIELKKKAVLEGKYELAEYLKRSEETLIKNIDREWVDKILIDIKKNLN